VTLLVDTSALLALYLADDRHHPEAVGFLQKTPRARFVLTDLILGELATRLAARAGPLRAVEVARGILASRRYEVMFLDGDLLGEALATMEGFADKRLSLADCASFALMRRLGVRRAFTFDSDFRDCGFEMLPA
jgi:predicted nucleic acid-binding protein